jgi:hypothetical protein
MQNLISIFPKSATLLSAVITVTLLAACGNSDSPPQLAGQVVGSYIENARVCMDANKNGQCDAGEPDTRSAKDGSFSLPIVASADLVADVGTDAFVSEKADFSDRKAVAARYVLRNHNSMWVSGITTLSAPTTAVSADIDTGASLDAARKKLADL